METTQQEPPVMITGYPINENGTPAYQHEQGVMLEQLTAGYAHEPYDPNEVWHVVDGQKEQKSIPCYVNGAWTYDAFPQRVLTRDDIARQRESEYKQRTDSRLLAWMYKLGEDGTLPANEDLQFVIEEKAKIKEEFPYNENL